MYIEILFVYILHYYGFNKYNITVNYIVSIALKK